MPGFWPGLAWKAKSLLANDVLYLPTYSSVSVLAIPLRTLCSEGSRDREETDVRNRLGKSFMECGDVLYLPTYSSVSVLAIPLRTLCSEGSRDREETDVRNRLGESFMECVACFWLMASGPE
ncbi:hypothetical protein NDU88_005796 [Pleurodeles waltl]|uniref:Uncharacterized protein n=1 Tax=Pleurodeles waltl TaxID=8319 RepID=A0AAV7RJP0_PLEWA|nr:hypothetical protein NDU88_005796 [Pleurodeles waltl]